MDKTTLGRCFPALLLVLVLTLLFAGCTSAQAAEMQAESESPAQTQVWGAALSSPAPDPQAQASTKERDEAALLAGTDMPIAEGMLSAETVRNAIADYQLTADSAAALSLINSTYTLSLTEDQKAGLLVFLFEGAGENSDPLERKDAMCVVVRGGQILYLSTCCTTIPDHPFMPWKNDGSDVPTLVSGIYAFDTVNHHGKYAALRVLDDQVIRFHSASEFYASVSNQQSIQVHRRGREENSPDTEKWANSIGCLLVGHAGTEPTDDYARFAHAVGILNESAGGSTPYQSVATGTLIVDRSLGQDYLRAVGYSDEAIAALAGN